MTTTISKDITSRLMVWFEQHRREMPWRGSLNPYHIWVSEMMLQQTQVATVEKYYDKWIVRFPNVYALADASLEDVLKIWEGLGYYTRARNFHKGAKYIVEHAENKDHPFPYNYNDWLKVPGVGPYTAAAVSSIAYGYPAGVVDANVMRVMARLFCIDKNIASQSCRTEIFTLMNGGFYHFYPGWVNQAWMELGSLQCTPNPDCSKCPLQDICCANQQGLVSEYPVKNGKKTIPTRRGVAFIVQRKDKYLLLQRRPEGFLGGLWVYPGYTLKSDVFDQGYFDRFIQENHLRIEGKLAHPVRHTYSHFHQVVDLYIASLDGEWINDHWSAMRWVNKNELENLPRPGITIKIHMRLRECDI